MTGFNAKCPLGGLFIYPRHYIERPLGLGSELQAIHQVAGLIPLRDDSVTRFKVISHAPVFTRLGP